MHRLRLALALAALTAPAVAADHVRIPFGPPPAAYRGVWARDGRCDLPRERLTVGARTAGFGRARMPVMFDKTWRGGYLYWNYDAAGPDNFQLSEDPRILIHNLLGFDKPGQERLARCDRTLRRVPLPLPAIPATIN